MISNQRMTKKIRIALAGNPNSGKSSVFNELTGSRQHVGNWPGVTVEKKEGEFDYNGYKVTVVDLPGIYSLSAYSEDERIARDFLTKESPDVVVSVVDASNLERNLYLVSQFLELGLNVVLDLNMIDLVENKGIKINIDKLSQILDIPVVKTVAKKGIGGDDLRKAIAESAERERGNNFLIDYGQDIEIEIEKLSSFLEDKSIFKEYPLRWLIIKLFERDADIFKKIKELPEWKEIEEEVLESIARVEKHIAYDLETAVAEKKYGFIEGLVRECTEKSFSLEERHELSDQIDMIVTNKFLGIPLFLGIMWLAFQMVFSVGAPLVDSIEFIFNWLEEISYLALSILNVPEWFSSFIADGVISGVGSVIVFLPNILLLFLFIAIMEDSGYMARVAFIMDGFMHALGLHGKSFIPMIIGFGCNIPGIMACRSLESKKDRILTILINPLMSCSARLPIYILFTSALFTKNHGLVIFSIYFLGIVLSIIVARIFKSIFFKEEVAPLIMELPPYRFPQIKGVIIHVWYKGSLFLRKAGTIILAGVVLIWLLSSLPVTVEYASKESLIGEIGSIFAPLLEPAGFGYWEAAMALIFGIISKEIVVGTLGTVFGAEGMGLREILSQYFTPLSAYAFMVMSLIYIPCIPAIVTIKNETSWKWAGLAVVYSIILGWGLAVLIYQVGSFFV